MEQHEELNTVNENDEMIRKAMALASKMRFSSALTQDLAYRLRDAGRDQDKIRRGLIVTVEKNISDCYRLIDDLEDAA